MKKATATLLLIFLISCGSDSAPEPPVTPSEALNEFLTGASFQVIDLDAQPVDTIYITNDMILSEDLYLDDQVNLSRPTQIIPFQDYLILNGFMSANVIAIDPQTGVPAFRIGGEGRGPGEFIQPFEIMSDGESLYIHDTSLKRFSRFDYNFQFQENFPFEPLSGSPNAVKAVMNSDYIVYENHLSSGLFSVSENPTILEVATISKPDSVVKHLMPRIIPSGMQPGAYNRVHFTMSHDNRLAAVYAGLPYLFLFDQFEHLNTVQFQTSYIDSVNNPSLTPFPPRGNDGERVSSLYISQLYLPNGELLLQTRGGIFRFRIGDDGHARLLANYYLKEKGYEGTGIRAIRGITYNPNDPLEIFSVGWEQIYKFRLPEI
ncbi:MAG: hypothetical protein JJU46_01025 [Balneolaceae bacterium]|nr:hypothetical protein [Balneolaceae bacterium]MCH8547406.1 TolB-like 6-bladed beta-propeller domain-containing protein [Balneolaceae bacterium]